MKLSYYITISVAIILPISRKAALFFKGSLCNSHWRVGCRIKADYLHLAYAGSVPVCVCVFLKDPSPYLNEFLR